MTKMVTFLEQSNDRIIRLRELLAISGLSRATIYSKMNPKCKHFDPNFPARMRLGASAVGWHLSAVLTWKESLKAA